MSRRLTEAYALAARLHARQHLEGAWKEPYINHLCDVAAMAAASGADETTLVAAVLHDTLEDTAATRDDLAAQFGADVAALVDWLTDDPRWAALPTPERKALQAAKMARAPRPAQLVKLADQTDNLEGRLAELAAWPLARTRAYLTGARQVVDACRGAAPELEARFDLAAQRLERALEAAEALSSRAPAAPSCKEPPT